MRKVKSNNAAAMEDNHKRKEIMIRKYKNVFGSEDGEAVLDFLQRQNNYGRTVFGLGMTQMDLAFLNGRQSVINDIMELLRTEIKARPEN